MRASGRLHELTDVPRRREASGEGVRRTERLEDNFDMAQVVGRVLH